MPTKFRNLKITDRGSLVARSVEDLSDQDFLNRVFAHVRRTYRQDIMDGVRPLAQPHKSVWLDITFQHVDARVALLVGNDWEIMGDLFETIVEAVYDARVAADEDIFGPTYPSRD